VRNAQILLGDTGTFGSVTVGLLPRFAKLKWKKLLPRVSIVIGAMALISRRHR
jgi:hypothetical protein